MAQSSTETAHSEFADSDVDTFNLDQVKFDQSARQTGMSFQRTRMSADRTLMAVIRTSLSLISFGFTIYQFFQRLSEASVLSDIKGKAGTFGSALVYLGVGMLILGIIYHLQFMAGIRKLRNDMRKDGSIYGESNFPISLTAVTAVVLLLIGLAAMASITFHVGPFG